MKQKVCADCHRTTDINNKHCPHCGSSCFESVSGADDVTSGQGQQAHFLRDVRELTEALGIETMAGVTYLIPASTIIPTSKTQIFSTAQDNQTSVEIHVLAGKSNKVKECRSLFKATLKGIGKAPKGVPQIQVTFAIDNDGLVTVEARDQATGRFVAVQRTVAQARMAWKAGQRMAEASSKQAKPAPKPAPAKSAPKQADKPGEPGKTRPQAGPEPKKTEPARPQAENEPGHTRKEEPAKDDSKPGAVIDLSDKANEILSKIARPDIYHINAFRVLEVSVTATTREASNQMRKLDMLEKLGTTTVLERGFLPLVPAPDADARREAYQRLSDPESRLIDELFWLWPLQMGQTDSKDEALQAIKRNDFSGAVAIWRQHEENYSEANVSMHNLAIMYHVLALDIERMQNTEPITKRQSQQKQEYWEQAFSRWQILLRHDGFWNRLRARTQELDDPRLTSGTVRRLQAGLPTVLLAINAALAVSAAQKGNAAETTYHVNLMHKSGFAPAVTNEALRRAVAPVRDRIKILCSGVEKETAQNPSKADIAARNLIEQSREPLKIIDMLLPKGHATRESAHDEVALRVLSSVFEYAGKTENWRVVIELLEQAVKIAASTTVRKRIEDNLATARGNPEYGICWFCKENPSEEKYMLEVKMHGNVRRNSTWQGTQVEWQKMSVKVPRCKRCRSIHQRMAWYGCSGLVAGAVLAFVIGSALQNGFAGFMTFAVLGASGFIVHYIRKPKNIKDEDYYKEFPSIKKLKSEGWDFGEKPPGVQ